VAEERRAQLGRVIRLAYEHRLGGDGKKLERPLPFGTRWQEGAVPLPDHDPCPPCGMMIVRPRSRDVLEYLAKKRARASEPRASRTESAARSRPPRAHDRVLEEEAEFFEVTPETLWDADLEPTARRL
jgi:hypothetical protein